MEGLIEAVSDAQEKWQYRAYFVISFVGRQHWTSVVQENADDLSMKMFYTITIDEFILGHSL